MCKSGETKIFFRCKLITHRDIRQVEKKSKKILLKQLAISQ